MEFSKLRDVLIAELEKLGYTQFTRGLLDGGCVMHKQMLIAHAEQKVQQTVLETLLTTERDLAIREFRQSNCLDGLQLQLGKLFDGKVKSYVFGDGVHAFPAYMRKHHPEVQYFSMKRMVGNRALVFHENALVHFYMAPYYLQWCHHVLRKIKSGNMLHVRVEAQLRCAEEMSGLRARAIIFDKIHQPWRVYINAVQQATGKPRSYLEQGPGIRKLYVVAKRLVNEPEPEFILEPSWRFLDCPDVVAHHEKWRVHRKNEPMLQYLYDGAASDQFLFAYLKVHIHAYTWSHTYTYIYTYTCVCW